MDPYEIATWRYEQIAPFFDESLSEEERQSLIAQRAKRPVLWPNGEKRPIHLATLYRWKALYEEPCRRCAERATCTRAGSCGAQFEALAPKKRKDAGTSRRAKTEWIEQAILLLLERPKRSFAFLCMLLVTYFSDFDLHRTTLARRLKLHPLWSFIHRQRKGGKRRRRRFEAKKPHDIWHLDAKGPFTVTYQSGEKAKFVILTILDGYSRAVLATHLALSESLEAAVRLFRRAMERWGLPNRVYLDRASVYDSTAFRCGLAQLGIRRIRIRRKKGRNKGNPQPNGKIEAYHRTLETWYLQELPYQLIIDKNHLEELLYGVVEAAYNPHYHRELKMSPLAALGGRRSDRPGKSCDDLDRAFRVRRRRKAHPVTGEISLDHGTFIVPSAHFGTRVDIAHDPAAPHRTFLVNERGEEILLKTIKAEPTPRKKRKETPAARGVGTLQRLTDQWRGRTLPVAEAGYGLPEICLAIGERLGRRVPDNEKEAAAIQTFCRRFGPFASSDFDTALDKAVKAIGSKRATSTLLTYLERLVEKDESARESEDE